MPAPITTQDLLDQVRDQIDESNVEDVTDADILQALNRAQRRAANVVVKHCPDLLLDDEIVTSTGSDTFAIPKWVFGQRISSVTIVQGSTEYPLTRIKARDLWQYTSSAVVSVPSVYAVKQREFIVKPTPSQGISVKVWAPRSPEALVLPQGRIVAVNTASNYVLVDVLGADLTTLVDYLGAFVNIVDAETGEIKVSLQVVAINTTTRQLTFKSTTPTYASVYDQTIAVAIPDTVELNDYVCSVQGTCVPDLPGACLDYYVQYAVAEIRRRMGESVQDDAAALQDLTEELKAQWAGREQSNRVANRARHWTRL